MNKIEVRILDSDIEYISYIYKNFGPNISEDITICLEEGNERLILREMLNSSPSNIDGEFYDQCIERIKDDVYEMICNGFVENLLS